MKYPWIDEYLMARRSVIKDLQPEWNWIRYHIGGKMLPLSCWMTTISHIKETVGISNMEYYFEIGLR